jgi:hypothetical protein
MSILIYFCALIGLLLPLAAGLDMASLKPYPRAKWTVAVYMNGDNELETCITGGVAVSSVSSPHTNPNR